VNYFVFSFSDSDGVMYYAYINGDDGSVIHSGSFSLSGSGEVHLFDDFYFNESGIYKKVDDGNGNVKKLAVAYGTSSYDRFMRECGGSSEGGV